MATSKRLMEPTTEAERAMWKIRELYAEIEQIVDAVGDPVSRLQVASFDGRMTQNVGPGPDYRDAKGKTVKVPSHAARMVRLRGELADQLLGDRSLAQVAALTGSTRATVQSLVTRYRASKGSRKK